MGFKRYLSRNDAIYGTSGNWFSNYNTISKNCTVVTNGLVWTVIYIGLIYRSDSTKRNFKPNELGVSLGKSK